MKFFYSIQNALKNTFYIDYFFKNFFFFFYKRIILSNMFYIVDKYLAEKFFFNVKKISNWLSIISSGISKMSIMAIIKVLAVVFIQILLLILL